LLVGFSTLYTIAEVRQAKPNTKERPLKKQLCPTRKTRLTYQINL